jgi:hypothetical protein
VQTARGAAIVAAEITPVEPVWVIPAKGAALDRPLSGDWQTKGRYHWRRRRRSRYCLALGDIRRLSASHRLDLGLQCAVSVETSFSTGASLGTVAAVVMVGSHSIGSG